MATNKVPTTEKKDQLEEVLKSLKSIISSCGGECQAESLHKDYRELIGSAVPFKQFNHGTFASFLQGYPEVFLCSNKGGKLFVRLKDDKAAAHIAKLARQQKATRKPNAFPKPARRPGPSSWNPAQGIHHMRRAIEQNWREPFRSMQMIGHPAPRQRNFSNVRPQLGGKPIAFPLRSGAPPRRPTKSPPPNKPKSPPPSKPKSPPPNSNAKQQQFSSQINNKVSVANNLRCPAPGKSNPIPLLGVRPPLLPTPPTPHLFPINPMPKMNPSALYYNDGNFCFPRAIRDNQEKQYAPYFEVPPRFKKVESKPTVKTNKQKLEEELKRRGYKQDLIFRSLPCGKKKLHWVSLVHINNVPVSSYPQEFAQAQEAEEEAARKALELLASQEDTSLPVTRDLMQSMERVKKILTTQTNGLVWLEHVQDLYKKEYQEVLPDNWAADVKDYNNAHTPVNAILVDNPVLNRWTVQMKEQVPQLPDTYLAQHINQTQQDMPTESTTELYNAVANSFYNGAVENEDYKSQNKINSEKVDGMNIVTDGVGGIMLNMDEVSLQEPLPQLPSLELPISNYWDIYVTNIEDIGSISFRLLGDNYNNAYDDVVTEMELHYMEEKNILPVSNPKVGGIYAAAYDESWCRVKVIKNLGAEVLVQFLDHGDQETLSTTQLHDLHDKFFQLPAQCVRCSLAGLEFSVRDHGALSLLEQLAFGQTLVAQVVSRDDSVSLIVYNTSTEEDININEKVSELIEKNFVEPTLPSIGGVVEVYLLHATSSGDIYVQIETETYKVLQNLLEIARSRMEEMLGKDAQVDLTRLYLARFSEDGEWHRGAPRGQVDGDGKVLMWFVDIGNTCHVLSSNIRPLEVTDKLTKIPYQALLCRLHNVPSSEGLQWTSRTCQRMLELNTEESPLLLKVHASGANGGPPQVELFKRLHPKNELVSINATLSMDESLFTRSNGDSNNNSLRKEVILSPSRMRNRLVSSDDLNSLSSPRGTSLLHVNKRYKQPDSLLPMDFPSVGDYFDVYITYAASPSNFAVQSWKMIPDVTAMMENMGNYYSNPGNLQTNIEVKAEGYYVIKHTDNFWYRAYVTSVMNGMITGLFVDFGDCFVTSQECVQPLPSVFRSLPCLAIKAKLSGVVAANLDWSPEDSYRFKELVEYCELVSIVTSIERERDTEELVLSLRLVDTSDPNLDIFIADILVSENRARKVN